MGISPVAIVIIVESWLARESTGVCAARLACRHLGKGDGYAGPRHYQHERQGQSSPLPRLQDMPPDRHLGYLVRTRALELVKNLLGSLHQQVQLGQLMCTSVWRLSRVMPPPLT